METWLAEFNGIGRHGGTDRSLRSRTSQVILATTHRIDLYSTSVEESDTEGYFFDFHESGLPPMLIKNSLMERRLSGQVTQSASQKATNFSERDKVIKIPNPGLLSK